MNAGIKDRRSTARTRKFSIGMALLLALLSLSACGGGGTAEQTGSLFGAGTAASIACEPSDSATFAECGSLMIALTDADGDFLNYTIDVTSLTLETANGRTVETLPRRTRINFSNYVDLTELVAVAAIPPATYVAGTLNFDYADAEVFVEAAGEAKAAVVTDLSGTPLTQSQVRISLSDRDQLRIVKGRSSLLQLDFDLGASHSVDIAPTPATAASEQFVIAELSPMDEKDTRVRGPLANVDADEMQYTVAIRPFHDRDGDFGRMQVNVSDETTFEIDEVAYDATEGLRFLASADRGLPTIALGTLDSDEREFTARLVLAGSSVPGTDKDAVFGNVIARDDQTLTVRGATIIAADRRAHFHDDVLVEIGPETLIFKEGHRINDLSMGAISIGQQVTVYGNIEEAATDALSPRIHVDATVGAVRMHVTHLLGTVNTVIPGQTDITLHGIDRRRVDIFDFSGTGMSVDSDADPDNYEILTGDLSLAEFATGKPIVATGFPAAFGTASPDFDARSIIDFTDVRSSLGIGWGSSGTTAPFTSAGPDGLILDNQNEDIGKRHYIKNGPITIDLTALDSNTSIVPRTTDRTLYYIKSNDSLRQYSDFGDFVEALTLSLNGSTAARSMHARGLYDSNTNTLNAYRIGIYLLE